QRRSVQQQAGLRTRRDQTLAGVLDMNDAITRNAVGAQLHRLQSLSAHRLDRVPPELGDLHDGNLMPGRRKRAPRRRRKKRRRKKRGTKKARVSRSRPALWTWQNLRDDPGHGIFVSVS